MTEERAPILESRGATVAWSEHEAAYADYARRYPSSARHQDARRIAARGGFSLEELTDHLGHPPTTVQPRT